MSRFRILAIAMLACAGCSTGPHDSVLDKVKYDFGMGEAPEGYVSGTDQVFARLTQVGEVEMKRMNSRGRLGEVKFEEDGLQGRYFKETKVYEQFFPLDAQPLSKGVKGERGYQGFIEYRYRIFRSPSKPTRVEAEAENPDIATGEEGREVLRYTFGASGTWNGNEGEHTKR
ncbi:MAG: hypothetical protein GC168_11430 [Candidatus Hydrogenedens sp.]|nr:hypothetical protein [Candidatus Hydrogenedens sp.]